MKFERGKDIKESLEIGIQESIKDIIRKRLKEAADFTDGWTIRKRIVQDIKDLTGWERVKDTTDFNEMRSGIFLLRLTCVDNNGNIVVIKVKNPFNDDV